MRTPAALTLALTLASCGGSSPSATLPAPTTSPPHTTAAEPATPSAMDPWNRWGEQFAAGDWKTFRAQLADDATVTPASSGMVISGPDNIITFFSSFAVGFPDLTNHVYFVFARDGQLVVVMRSSGTNTGAMMAQQPTGKKTSFLGMSVIDIRDGKIHKLVAYADNLNFMGQLGQWKGPFRPVAEEQAPHPVTISAEATEAEKANVAVANTLVALVNGHDAPKLTELYAPDAVFDDQSEPGAITTRTAIGRRYSDFFVSFPDTTISDVDAWGAGDYVIATYKLTGTQEHAYRRMEKPNPAAAARPLDPAPLSDHKKINLEAAMLLEIRNGMIANHWTFVDGMALAFQLGAIKP